MASKGATRLKVSESSSIRSLKQYRDLPIDKPVDYTSHGVKDNDIFLLPGSDFQLLGFLTFVACVVRLFRIYQPSSVVFDEVQYEGYPTFP